MARFPKCLLFLIITTFLFTLVALGLVSFHTKTHCWTTTSDTISEKTTTDCLANSDQICSESHAFAVHYTAASTGLIVKTQLYCPWRLRTAIVGIIALSLSQFSLIIALFAAKRYNLRTPLIISGFAAILPLLATLGMMIKDLIDGFKYNNEYKTSEFFRPATYLSNAILVFVSIFLAGSVVYFTVNTWRTSAQRHPGHPGRVASVSAVSFNQSSHAHHNLTTKGLNTSMSQVQYTGGESGILRENQVYSLPSASSIGRRARANNQAYLNSSISQSGASSGRILITQRNESPGRNSSTQSSARRGSAQNIPSQPSTRRDQTSINRSPKRNLEQIVKGNPQSVSPGRSSGQDIKGQQQQRQQQQSNSPRRSPIYLNMSENKPKVQGRNLSTSRHLTPVGQALPVVRSPGKSSNHAEQGRRRSMNGVT